MNEQNNFGKYFYLVCIVLFALFLLSGLKDFISAFLGSIVFYIVFKPMMQSLCVRFNWNKSLAACLIIIISFIIVLLPFTLLGTLLYEKVVVYATHPEMLTRVVNKIIRNLQKLPIKLPVSQLQDQIPGLLSGTASSAFDSLLQIFSAITMMYFFLYFLLINFNQLEETLIKYLPFKREKISVFGKELVSQTYSNAFGVPVICVAQGICAYFLFLICGLEDAALWAFILGIASIIPVVGTAIVWGPAGFYLLSIGHIWQGVTILISGLIILSNVDNVFRFVIQKRMSDVHPVVTVLGIIIGLNFFGLPGLVFGPLLISYLLLMIKLYYIQFGDLDAAPTPETPQQTRQLKITLLNELMRLTKKNH